MKLREDIQILRAIAVLAVIFFHFDETVFPNGYLGVDVFFVISGYVISKQLLPEGGLFRFNSYILQMKGFFIRRFWRLTPALLVTVFVTSLLACFLISADELRSIAKQNLYAVLFLANIGSFKINGDYFNNLGSPLIHTWSLAVEAQFYFIAPVIVVLLYTFVRKGIVRVLATSSLVLLSFIFFSSFSSSLKLYNLLGIQHGESFVFYSPLSRVWEFGLGVGAALIRASLADQACRKTSRFKSILTLGIFLIFLFGRFPNPLMSTLFIVGFTGIVLRYGLLQIPFSRIRKTFVWLGDRSYSIYLVHMPIIYFSTNSYFIQDTAPSLKIVVQVLAAFLSFFLGGVLYKYVEDTYRKRSNEKLRVSRKREMLIVTVSLSLLTSTMYTASSKNFFNQVDQVKRPISGFILSDNCSPIGNYVGNPCKVRTVNKAKGLVLLIGDSHALHLGDAVSQISQKNSLNFVLWTQPGCEFFLELYSPTVSRECLTRNQQALSWIKREKPSLVILSQYNGHFLPQEVLRRSTSKLLSTTPELLLVGNTPVFADRNFLQTPPFFSLAKSWDKRPLRSDMDWSNFAISKQFLTWANNVGAHTIDLSDVWCDKESCLRFRKGNWLWMDVDHLSYFGAQEAIPPLDAAVRSILNLPA